MKRALRLVLIWMALAAGPPLALWLPPCLSVAAGITVTAAPASAQTSGGYQRPGGGGYSRSYGGGGYSGGFGGYDRRPSIGGGYARPSGSSYSGFGGSFGGGDLAISRRASSQALRDYRASQERSLAATARRPSSGWDDSGWETAPLGRRPLPSGLGGGSAPGYTVSTPRFGVWDGVLAW